LRPVADSRAEAGVEEFEDEDIAGRRGGDVREEVGLGTTGRHSPKGVGATLSNLSLGNIVFHERAKLISRSLGLPFGSWVPIDIYTYTYIHTYICICIPRRRSITSYGVGRRAIRRATDISMAGFLPELSIPISTSPPIGDVIDISMDNSAGGPF
jgi:hypothetical protein